MLYRISLLIVLLLTALPSNAIWWMLNSEKKAKTKVHSFSYSGSGMPSYKEQGSLRIAYVSDINLYPVPTANEKFPSPPKSKVGILYEESQVILQEVIRDILKLAEKQSFDFVLFGGSQVANNMFWDLFQDINHELTKYQVDNYYVLGIGEAQGPLSMDKITKKPFYLLKTKGTNIIALDNSRGAAIPRYLPEEATEQSVWLGKTLKKLEKSQEEIFIFSYKPLHQRTRAFIDEHKNLNIRLIAHSYDLHFALSKPTETLQVNQSIVVGASSFSMSDAVLLTNPSASVYPNNFTVIERKSNGDLTIEEVPISLAGVRKKAKKALK